jgi:hypothetical protein
MGGILNVRRRDGLWYHDITKCHKDRCSHSEVGGIEYTEGMEIPEARLLFFIEIRK